MIAASAAPADASSVPPDAPAPPPPAAEAPAVAPPPTPAPSGPVVAEVEVTSVARLSPSFVRIAFGGPGLAELGVDGPVLDARIKLVFPGSGRRPPALSSGDGWFEQWRALPEDERGAMRTYSIRDLYGSGADVRLVVDVVLHLAPGRSGPASRWAAGAGPGDRLVVIGPRRGEAYAGIEFPLGASGRVLLAADETGVPAASRILADLPGDARGVALLEVPRAADALAVHAPDGVDVRWLPRDGVRHGELLVAGVRGWLRGEVAVGAEHGPRGGGGRADEGSADVWETPTWSASGEDLVAPPSPDVPVDLHAWVAAESSAVARLRRLLSGYGLPRSRAAYMGYWREGVAAPG